MAGYVTLPANSNAKDFPANTNSTFTVRLDKPLTFGAGKWEVGLAELHYPTSWSNVSDGQMWYKRPRTDGSGIDDVDVLHIREGRYASFTELVHEMQRCFTMYRVQDTLEVYYDAVRNVSFLRINKQEYQLKLSRDISMILGFRSDLYYPYGRHRNSANPDINKGFSSLYVYSDIAEFRPVGDVSAPLLRVVPIQGKSRFLDAHAEFRNIHYIPVPNTNTDLITVLIRTDSGEPVPFTGGKVVLTVHFRQITGD
jgi:hypothetical protein